MAQIVRNRGATLPVIVAIALGLLLTFTSFRFQRSATKGSTRPTKNKSTKSQHSSNALRHNLLASIASTPTVNELTTAPTAEAEKNCQLVKGDWCYRWYAMEPVPWNPPPQGDKECLWNCNNVGVCDAMKGICQCPAGWQGDACDVRMRRPCSQNMRQWGFTPYDEPVNWDYPGMYSRCSGYCDDDIGLCFCPPETKYGRKPADVSAPMGTPPVAVGRPLGMHCQPNQTPDGKPSTFGDITPAQVTDWCNNDKPEVHCPCYINSVGGEFCDKPREAFCPNQCNGHGVCDNGFCKCDKGWFGHDCAYRMANIPWTPGRETTIPWLKDLVHNPASKDPDAGAVRKQPLIYVYELPPMYNALMLQYKNDMWCHHRAFQLSETANETYYALHAYNLETGLHEYLLQSEHRTLDPEEADFFYIPIYVTCWILPVHTWGDFPNFHGGPGANRAQSATNMMLEAWSWLRSHYPYWDRNQGRDHIVLHAHDEGSCYVPAAMRNAIILSHWGQLGFNDVSETNYDPDRFDVEFQHPQFQPEGHLKKLGRFQCHDPSKDLVVPSMWPPMKYDRSPVFGNPARKRFIFAFHKGRTMFEWPRFSRGTRQNMTKKAKDDDWWGKYKIHIDEKNPKGYEALTYSELLASSVFCLVLQGDGWTSRFEDGITHGCIPVIIMDNKLVPFETQIDVTKFSVRVAEADMFRLPKILQAISQEQIEEYQRNAAKVWRRYMYTGATGYDLDAKKLLRDNKDRIERERKEQKQREKEDKKKKEEGGDGKAGGDKTDSTTEVSLPEPELGWTPGDNDAFETILQWLATRMLEKRQAQLTADGAAAGEDIKEATA